MREETEQSAQNGGKRRDEELENMGHKIHPTAFRLAVNQT
jgi:hypothetical protein